MAGIKTCLLLHWYCTDIMPVWGARGALMLILVKVTSTCLVGCPVVIQFIGTRYGYVWGVRARGAFLPALAMVDVCCDCE